MTKPKLIKLASVIQNVWNASRRHTAAAFAIAGAWWLVGVLAVDGKVHPMAEVVWAAAAWTVCVLYWLVITHWVRP